MLGVGPPKGAHLGGDLLPDPLCSRAGFDEHTPARVGRGELVLVGTVDPDF